MRIGGGSHPVKRIPLPRFAVPVLDVGDVELGVALPITVLLDRDPGCDLRAAGPVGRTGLQVVPGTRTATATFDVVIPEEGLWEFTLGCRGEPRSLSPSLMRIGPAHAGKEVRMVVR